MAHIGVDIQSSPPPAFWFWPLTAKLVISKEYIHSSENFKRRISELCAGTQFLIPPIL